MQNIEKILTLTSLEQIEGLSEEEKRNLSELFPTFEELEDFINSQQLLREKGIEEILATDAKYPFSKKPKQ